MHTIRAKICKLYVTGLKQLEPHQVGKLLTTIAGFADSIAAVFIAKLGDPVGFDSGDALAVVRRVVYRT